MRASRARSRRASRARRRASRARSRRASRANIEGKKIEKGKLTEGSKTKKKVKGKKTMLGIEGKKESEIIDNRNSVIKKPASTARSVILKRVYSKSYHNMKESCA